MCAVTLPVGRRALVATGSFGTKRPHRGSLRLAVAATGRRRMQQRLAMALSCGRPTPRDIADCRVRCTGCTGTGATATAVVAAAAIAAAAVATAVAADATPPTVAFVVVVAAAAAAPRPSAVAPAVAAVAVASSLTTWAVPADGNSCCSLADAVFPAAADGTWNSRATSCRNRWDW